MVDRALLKFVYLSLALSFFSGTVVFGRTENGNELALYVTEAKTDKEVKELVDKALRKQYFFRYLKIYSMEKGTSREGPTVTISAMEPSSAMYVRFVVRKSESLIKLMEEPETKVNDCISLVGVVADVNKKASTITLNPVIIRNKDRDAPRAGKEFLYEIDQSAGAYSFTGGDEPVQVSKRDMDLLAYKDKYYGSGTTKEKKAWANFLITEIAKRDKERRAKALGAYQEGLGGKAVGQLEAVTNQPPEVEQSNIIDDPE